MTDGGAGGPPLPGSPGEEEELSRRFASGDEEALMALLGLARPDLERAAARGLPPSLRHRVSVADVMQEARLAAFEARASFVYAGEGSFARWVAGIARNKALQAVRHHGGTGKRAAGREARGARAPSLSGLPAPGPSPSQVAVGAETATLARRALESLDPRQREMLRLTREEGLTVAAAGDRMDLPLGSAKRLYGQALVRFRGTFDRLRGSSVE